MISTIHAKSITLFGAKWIPNTYVVFHPNFVVVPEDDVRAERVAWCKSTQGLLWHIGVLFWFILPEMWTC